MVIESEFLTAVVVIPIVRGVIDPVGESRRARNFFEIRRSAVMGSTPAARIFAFMVFSSIVHDSSEYLYRFYRPVCSLSGVVLR